MNLSYWELESFFRHIDLVVIGGGIVGLSSALHAQRNHPEMQIAVLEAGILPSGASTKNAGFACFGSVSELLMDMKAASNEQVVALAIDRYKGLQKLRSILGDRTIGFQQKGGMELFMDNERDVFEECTSILDDLNTAFEEEIGQDCYRVMSPEGNEFGFNGVRGIIANQYEGQIHTGRMMKALMELCMKEGITLLSGMKANALQWDDHGVDITLNDLTIRTGRVIVATNGFAASLLNVPVHPARAQVLITKPVKNLKVSGTFHYQQGYYYFRDIDNRVLLGGGRNLDPKGETTTMPGVTPQIQNELERLLSEVILPDMPFEIDHRWSGVMGVGSEKSPLIQAIHPRVICAVRMGGMGVALGALAGERAAAMI